MKLSTILSFTALSATATLAFPLSPFHGLRGRADLEERDVYAPAPVRRSDVAPSAEPTATESPPSAEPTATESPPSAEPTTTESSESTTTDASSSDIASETLTSSASEATSTALELSSSSSDDSTNTWLYSTITQNGAMTTPPASTMTLDPTTETASATTETEAPQSTSSDVSRNDGNNNNDHNRNNNDNNVNVDISQQVVIRIKEVIRIREVVVVERPVLVAVQVNIKVRQTIIVNHIRDSFFNRFDNWNQNVVDQLGLVISQQFDILTRSRNNGFDNLSNDQYNRFVSKFISQFEVFQSFQLVDVQQFVTVLEGFGVNQLGTFFGRSDSLFSQDTFNRFNVQNDFKVFVQQLTVIVQSVSGDSFNSDDLFGLGSGSGLIAAGSIQV